MAQNFMSGSSRPFIIAGSDWELRRPVRFNRIALYVRHLRSHMSRRAVPDFLNVVICEFDGDVLNPDSTPYEVRESYVDDVFDDGSFRWLDALTGKADEPLKQRPHKKTLSRLRVIDLAARLDPDPAWRSWRPASGALRLSRTGWSAVTPRCGA